MPAGPMPADLRLAPANRLVDRHHRLRRELPRPSGTPFTFWYLVLLLVSTGVLLLVPSGDARSLLSWSSTDVHHLTSAPLRVLVASALWLPNLDWLLYVALFSAVLAPVERRIGPRWTVAVFASGHVVATLLTELPIAWAIRHGYLPHRAGHRLDVGVSYGFYAVVGVLVGLLPRRVGTPAALVALLVVVVPLLVATDVLAAVGHVVALAVGFTWWPWLTRRGPARRVTRPGQPRPDG